VPLFFFNKLGTHTPAAGPQQFYKGGWILSVGVVSTYPFVAYETSVNSEMALGNFIPKRMQYEPQSPSICVTSRLGQSACGRVDVLQPLCLLRDWVASYT
jgi:hypothetical protein